MTVIAVAVLATFSIGAGLFEALAGIEPLADDPLGGFFAWLTLVLAGALIGFIGLVIAIVVVARSRPKVAAIVALLVEIVLPWLGAATGAKFGGQILSMHLHEAIVRAGGAAVDAAASVLQSAGVDNPIVLALIRLLGAG